MQLQYNYDQFINQDTSKQHSSIMEKITNTNNTLNQNTFLKPNKRSTNLTQNPTGDNKIPEASHEHLSLEQENEQKTLASRNQANIDLNAANIPAMQIMDAATEAKYRSRIAELVSAVSTLSEQLIIKELDTITQVAHSFNITKQVTTIHDLVSHIHSSQANSDIQELTAVMTEKNMLKSKLAECEEKLIQANQQQLKNAQDIVRGKQELHKFIVAMPNKKYSNYSGLTLLLKSISRFCMQASTYLNTK